jgi:hypothetical protein
MSGPSVLILAIILFGLGLLCDIANVGIAISHLWGTTSSSILAAPVVFYVLGGIVLLPSFFLTTCVAITVSLSALHAVRGLGLPLLLTPKRR